MVPATNLLNRFRADLDALIQPTARLGIAVSGGPDSLALLLLAAAVRPGRIEAATVDHGLRSGSRDEAEEVADICAGMGITHAILSVEWDLPPVSAVQEQARAVRYGALGAWLADRKLEALLTGHHLDDQAETLVMRLNRGSGVRGLAGMRPTSPVLGSPDQVLLRPLLSWRRTELSEICEAANLSPAIDPTNMDENFERARVRQALGEAGWLDPIAVAKSGGHLASADEALNWAVAKEWSESVEFGSDELVYRLPSAPVEIIRRIVTRAIAKLALEGNGEALRGRELDRLISDLQRHRTTTLRGVRCAGGLEWRFTRAPPRRRLERKAFEKTWRDDLGE
jgi:tRNA(Ile)-lysidine synthase